MPQLPTLERYTLLRSLAVGGMGEVFLARQRSDLQRLVAVKLLLRSYSTEREFVQMFLTEASVVAQLNHPNIVQVHDIGCEDEQYYIVMEYLAGDSLQRVIAGLQKRGLHLPMHLACDVLAAICDALAHAHEAGLIHRDVTPSNVMLCEQGGVKLIDFGVVRSSSALEKTNPGVLKGKFGYMAPEYLGGGEYDHRVDIYSLGVVLWETLTGQRIFGGKSQAEIMQLVLAGRIPPVDAVNPAVPRALGDVVARALATEPARRYATAGDLADALREAQQQIATDGTFPTLARWFEHFLGEEVRAQTVAHQRPVAATAEVPDGGASAFDAPAEESLQVIYGDGTTVSGQKVTASAFRKPPERRGPMPALLAVAAVVALVAVFKPWTLLDSSSTAVSAGAPRALPTVSPSPPPLAPAPKRASPVERREKPLPPLPPRVFLSVDSPPATTTRPPRKHRHHHRSGDSAPPPASTTTPAAEPTTEPPKEPTTEPRKSPSPIEDNGPSRADPPRPQRNDSPGLE